jgi:thiol-disulfide isomerase/thioredoxin
MATVDDTRLSHEGNMPSLAVATEWLGSKPVTPADLRGRVVLVDFWTFTCINWIRTAPYLRAWDERYRDHGLTVIGVHTPEFSVERDVDRIRAAIEQRRIAYPVAVDSEYAVWDAFANRYWPALYLADREGRLRYHHFGEGAYDRSERVIQQLLGVDQELVSVEGHGDEAPPDWDSLGTPETYAGFIRTQGFASPGGAALDERRAYAAPQRLRLNHWALTGEWTIGRESALLNEAGGGVTYRFRARDLHLVMGSRGSPVRFRVTLDGGPPGAAHGVDVDADGNGAVSEVRLYQLIRQQGSVSDRTFELTFLDPGVTAYVFTFG